MNRGFGSDNHSGVHPRLLQAIVNANLEHAPSYGTDEGTEEALQIFKKHFGPQTQTFFVFNGTAANSLAVSSMIQSYESLFCADHSHLNVDECGAPEFFSGGKLIPIASTHGKMKLLDLEAALVRRGDQHSSQARGVSLTQPTEVGTVYTLDEIHGICTWAHKQGMWVHMDGARLCNAVTTLGTSFQKMTTDLGVDLVSFGGTKNGFLFGEALVFLNPKLAQNFQWRRKQACQLPSKTRFISAQFKEYLGTSLWQEISAHECTMAQKLFELLSEIKGLKITHPRQSNAVFVKIPQALIKPLRKKFFFYVWDENTFECRLMTSWDTQEAEILGFAKLLSELITSTSGQASEA